MLTTVDIGEVLHGGHELRHVEFKGAGATDDKPFLVKVARAALSLGNLRDGGHVIIGVDDANPRAMLPGLDDAQLESWTYDIVCQKLAVYSDPPLRLALDHTTLSNGSRVAVLQVLEFEDVPHLCAKEFPNELRHGGLYVRPRRGPSSLEVASSVEMREVIELAVQKALRTYVETAERAGLRFTTSPAISEEQLFDDQRTRGWT